MNNKVINKLRQKQQNGSFTTFNIGPELRYVGGQQNSNVRNLEEQLILDTDTDSVVTEGIVSPAQSSPYYQKSEVTKYRKKDSTENYYVLEHSVKSELLSSFDSSTNTLFINFAPRIIEDKEDLSFFVNSSISSTLYPFMKRTSLYDYEYNSTTGAFVSTIFNILDAYPEREPAPVEPEEGGGEGNEGGDISSISSILPSSSIAPGTGGNSGGSPVIDPNAGTTVNSIVGG